MQDTILLGGMIAVALAYYNRHTLMRLCIKGVNQAINYYIDWTWQPRDNGLSNDSDYNIDIVDRYDSHIIYRYSQGSDHHIHFGQEAPEIPFYEEDRVEKIIVYSGSSMVEPSSLLTQYIRMSLGPGCSLKPPTLNQLRSLEPLQRELDSVTKIIINMESLSEHVVL